MYTYMYYVYTALLTSLRMATSLFARKLDYLRERESEREREREREKRFAGFFVNNNSVHN